MLSRMTGLAARALLFALLTLVVAEIALRIAAAFVPDRASVGADGTRRILCVGDSHTYGAGVRPDEAYPAQLQRFLDEQAPDAYAVVNLGVPGLSTAQVRARLPEQVARLRPATIVVWAGVNNEWNRAESPLEPTWRDRVGDLAGRSRVYRLVRVWLRDLRLRREGEAIGLRDGERPHYVMDPPVGIPERQLIDWGSGVERIRYAGGAKRSADEMEEQTAHDLEEIVAYARGVGVPVVLVSYPLDLRTFIPANRAIHAAAARFNVPLVDSADALARVPKDERIFRWALHPGPPVYREIARDVATMILREPSR